MGNLIARVRLPATFVKLAPHGDTLERHVNRLQAESFSVTAGTSRRCVTGGLTKFGWGFESNRLEGRGDGRVLLS